MLGGLALGLSALGVGFSDSVQVHNIYNALVVVWEIFNVPAGVYILHVKEPNWLLWGECNYYLVSCGQVWQHSR